MKGSKKAAEELAAKNRAERDGEAPAKSVEQLNEEAIEQEQEKGTSEKMKWNTPPEKPKPENNPESDDLDFETVDLGDVRFIALEEPGEFFIGTYQGELHSPEPLDGAWSKGDDKFDGLKFTERGTGDTCILPIRWQLVNFFVNKDGEAEKVRWNENPVFHIAVIERVKAAKGTVVKHRIGVAYPTKK